MLRSIANASPYGTVIALKLPDELNLLAAFCFKLLI
jgi:hypothetical protein